MGWLTKKNRKRMASSNVGIQNTKNGMLLAYIANRVPDIHLRKLLKIVYLIDEFFVKKRGYPLTWFTYYAWAKGPVAREVYNVKNGNFREFVTARKERQTGEEKSKWIVNTTNPNLSKIQLFKEMEE
ncbi:MAG: SocA family protein [Bacteroidales bacterium]|nr:SocA family protein [Bacteroidales bacterium]